MADLLLNNFSIEGASRCHLRRSARARRMRIELRPDGSLLIVVPKMTREDQWLAFVLGKRDWIRRNLAGMQLPVPGQSRGDTGLPERIDLQYTGRQYLLCCRQGSRKRLVADGSSIHIYTREDSGQQASDLLTRWLKVTAKETFTRQLDAIAAATGLEWNRLTIRGQRTRWGSCSMKKNISLNYKLLFLPAPLADHVLLHELVHTREMNHSARFWELMKRHDPNCSQHRRELKLASRYLPAWLER